MCPDRLAYFLNYIEGKGPSLEHVLAHIRTLPEKAKDAFGNLNIHKSVCVNFTYQNSLHSNYPAGTQDHNRLKTLNGMDTFNEPFTELIKLA